ncbi:tetratricopeptide repeat protein [Aerosakkonema funiforme]
MPKFVAIAFFALLCVSGLVAYKIIHKFKASSSTDNNITQAITDCTNILLEEPSYDVLKKAVVSVKKKEHLQQKILCYQSQIQKNATDVNAYINLGEAYRRLGDPIAARQAYQKALVLNSNLQEAKLGLALVEQDSGNIQAANQVIEDGLALQENAIAYFYKGVILYEQKNIDGAKEAFQKAIEEDPNYAPAHYTLGILLDEQGKLDEAQPEYEQAINLSPNMVGALYKLGLILYKQGKRVEAISEYQQAIDLEIDWVEAHNNIGVALAEQGYLEEAVYQLQTASQMEPNNENIFYNLGLVLSAQDSHDAAIAAFKEAIRINPKFTEAHVAIGNIWREADKLDEAIAAYREAIRINPKLVLAHNNLGLALQEQGQITAASAEYQEAIRYDSDGSLDRHQLPYFLYR